MEEELLGGFDAVHFEIEERIGVALVALHFDLEGAFDVDFIDGVGDDHALGSFAGDGVLYAGGLPEAAADEGGNEGEVGDIFSLGERNHETAKANVDAVEGFDVGGNVGVGGGIEVKVAEFLDGHGEKLAGDGGGVGDAGLAGGGIHEGAGRIGGGDGI